MRVALVHSSFAVRGGAERYLRDLARELTRRGHTVAVFARASAHAEPADHPAGSRISARIPLLRKAFTHLGDLFDPTGLRVREVAGFRPDVVHVHNWQGVGILPVARLARAYPTCHTLHDYALGDPNCTLANRGRGRLPDLLLRLRSAWLLRRLRRVTLLWPAGRTREVLRSHVPGVPDGQVVPLAVDLGPQPEWPAGRRDTFLFLGALTQHKGIDVLLDAWGSGATAGELLVAGDGPLRPLVEEAARRYPTVAYLGHVDQAGKVAALGRAGWLVFPSRRPESFGLSCVEALSAGRPIIAAAASRPSMASDTSLLTYPGTGSAVESGGQLAALLRAAATMPDEEYRALSASARADGVRVDWSTHVDAVLRVYAELAGTDANAATGAGQAVR